MEKDIIAYLSDFDIDMRYCIDEKTGEYWYVVSDLFKSLGYKNPSKKVSDMCPKHRKYQFESNGGKQYYLCINYYELLKVILSLRKNHQFEEIQDFILKKLAN